MTTQTSNLEQVVAAVSALSQAEQAILFDSLKENLSDYLAQRRQARAWELARTAANLLREKFAATRVVVFGALFKRIKCGHSADIELAAWGVPEKQYLAAAEMVANLNPEFEIDLLELEICSSHLLQSIEKYGVEV